MWSACSICLPALAAFWVIGQLEILNLAEISILQGKKISPVNKNLHNLFLLLYQVTFTYPFTLSSDTALLLALCKEVLICTYTL